MAKAKAKKKKFKVFFQFFSIFFHFFRFYLPLLQLFLNIFSQGLNVKRTLFFSKKILSIIGTQWMKKSRKKGWKLTKKVDFELSYSQFQGFSTKVLLLLHGFPLKRFFPGLKNQVKGGVPVINTVVIFPKYLVLQDSI